MCQGIAHGVGVVEAGDAHAVAEGGAPRRRADRRGRAHDGRRQGGGSRQ